MPRFSHCSCVFVTVAMGCTRVFPGPPEEGETQHADAGHQPLGVDAANQVDVAEDSSAPASADAVGTRAEGTTEHTTPNDLDATAPSSPTEWPADASSTTPLPTTPTTLHVCWLDPGYEEEKAWIRDVLEANIEPIALIDLDGWSICAQPLSSEITVALNGQSRPLGVDASPEPNSGSFFVSLNVGTTADAGDASSKELNHCDVGDSPDASPFVDLIGRLWSSERHYCIAAEALSGLMRQLLPSHTSFACVDPTDDSAIVLKPDVGYHDATSVFSECPTVGAYLSPLDHTQLGETWGRRRGSQIWFGRGSLASLYGAPVAVDHLLVDTLRVPGDARQTPAIGDFNGDGFDDLFLYGKGDLTDALVFGASPFTWAPARADQGGEYVPLAGDFDGDGCDDLFWYAVNEEEDSIWFGAHDDPFSRTKQLDVAAGYRPVAGDFDGNGLDDLFLHAPGAAADFVLYAQVGATFSSYTAGPVLRTYVPLAGDFDGNGFDDVLLYGVAAEPDYIWWSFGTTAFEEESVSVKYTYAPATGDFDGNGTSDILWARDAMTDPLWLFDPADSHIGRATTTCTLMRAETEEYAEPFVGDFDGDGFSDVFWL